ncbi:hypothetical protein ACNKHX_07555 [Shigella flexneri]
MIGGELSCSLANHPMLRTGVKQLISMAPAITVVGGQASNGEQGIELAESLRSQI